MISEPAEDISFELTKVSEEYYGELVRWIKARLRAVRDAESEEGGMQDEGHVSLVRNGG